MSGARGKGSYGLIRGGNLNSYSHGTYEKPKCQAYGGGGDREAVIRTKKRKEGGFKRRKGFIVGQTVSWGALAWKDLRLKKEGCIIPHTIMLKFGTEDTHPRWSKLERAQNGTLKDKKKV